MLKMVLKMESARPGPLLGEEVMGFERFWHTRGRNMFICSDCLMRCNSRLYAAMNSVETQSW